jgi:hypothetical protein
VDPEPAQPPPGDPASSSSNDPGVSEGIGLPWWVDEAEWVRQHGDLCEQQEPEDPVTAFYDDPDVGPPLDSDQEPWEILTARAAEDGADYQALIARGSFRRYADTYKALAK